MWRRLNQVLAASLLAASCASSGLAQPRSEPTVATDPTDQALADFNKAMVEARYSDALAALDKINLEPDNLGGRAVMDMMRASALLGIKRDSEARLLMAEGDRLAPQIPEPSSTLFRGALQTRRFDIAADALDRMIARYPDVVRAMDWDLMRFFVINQPKDQGPRNDQRLVALAELGYGGDTERGHYLAEDAVGILVKSGDLKRASDLLPFVKEPLSLENMLIQKRYSPLWPQIEQLAGPHLDNVKATAVSAAERVYDENPSDHWALANYVNTLRHAGLFGQAIALRSKIPETAAAMSSADEDMGWAVNNVAYALHDAGKRVEADNLFALLNDAPMPKENWRVSMKINRLEFLVHDGRADRAAPLIEPTAKTEGSPYAAQLVRRLRYCTLVQLGRAAEADEHKPDLLAHASDAPGPTIDALLCGGYFDDAEKVATTALANPDERKRSAFEADFVRELQSHPLTGDDPSIWQSRWGDFRKRPAIAAAFDRLGRDMPEQYLPNIVQVRR